MDFQHGKPREGSLGRATETRPKGLGPWVWDSRPAVSGGAALGPEMGWDQSAPFPIGGDPDATIPYCAEPTTVAPGDLSTLQASDAGVRESASGRQVSYIHFRDLLPPDGILPRAKFTLCPSMHHPTSFSGYIFAIKASIDNRKKNLLNSNISPTWSYNIANFGLLAAEICWRV